MSVCCKRKRSGIQWQHFVVTDVVWAKSATDFNTTSQQLQDLGVIMQDGVNAFDFMRSLRHNKQISPVAQLHGFDIIVMCGVNFGVFNPIDGALDCSHPVAAEQYEQNWKLEKRIPQTSVFHEAVLGQDPYTTIINIHAENHQRYYLSAASMTYLRLGLFNPAHLRMRTGKDNKESKRPLTCTITSHSIRRMSDFIKVNSSTEEQLDLNKLMLDTLTTGGHVLVLGAGRLDICRELLKAAKAEQYATRRANGVRRTTSLTEPGRRAKIFNNCKATYWDHSLKDGKVVFEHVVDWTLCAQFGWCASGVSPKQDRG